MRAAFGRIWMVVGASSLAAGCEAPLSPFAPGGPEAGAIAAIAWVVIAVFSLTVLVMGGLIVRGALRRRGSLAEHAPIDSSDGKRWILIGGVTIPAVVLTVLFLVTLGALRTIPDDGSTVVDLQIDVTAHQWWWEVDYAYDDLQRRFSTANELHIPVGRKVRINLASTDVIHSFWVPRLHGKLDAIPGKRNSLVLEASEPGVYWGECAEYCGMQHAHMRFLVVAHEPAQFEAWAARQRLAARAPTDAMLVRGRDAFVNGPCALCHRIRGTNARGEAAPDLTHVGSRRTLAAGTLPNDRAHLQAWVVDAQSLKPGAHMPSLNAFDGRTLNALVSYLESLE